MHEIKKVHHFSADQLKSALFEINEVLLFAKKTPLNIENLAGKIKNIKKTRKLFKKMLKTKIGLWHYFRYLFRR
ncbi:MAG: hypothetical protein HON94_07345 [Methylococcales bacterium]|nr:hypothetical protein [Methylococcales bacterium]